MCARLRLLHIKLVGRLAEMTLSISGVDFELIKLIKLLRAQRSMNISFYLFAEHLLNVVHVGVVNVHFWVIGHEIFLHLEELLVDFFNFLTFDQLVGFESLFISFASVTAWLFEQNFDDFFVRILSSIM